jgi:drug/metabolite transporter (DMT)-like permease
MESSLNHSCVIIDVGKYTERWSENKRNQLKTKFSYIKKTMNIYIVLAIQLLFASATHIAAKAVAGEVDALTLTLLRNVISALGFSGILIVRGMGVRMDKGYRRSFLLLGFLVVFNQYLYLYGMKYTTAANGALLYALTPIFVLLLSRLVHTENITVQKSMGIFFAFMGVTIVIFERGVNTSIEFAFGNIIVLLAVITYALFTILGKPLASKFGAVSAAASANYAGLLFIVPFGLYNAITFPFERLHTIDWMGILYLGIGTSVISYLLWYYALRRIDATKLAVFANGQPVVASILSVVFLGATITPQFIVGGVITLVGVIITQKNGKTVKQSSRITT